MDGWLCGSDSVISFWRSYGGVRAVCWCRSHSKAIESFRFAFVLLIKALSLLQCVLESVFLKVLLLLKIYMMSFLFMKSFSIFLLYGSFLFMSSVFDMVLNVSSFIDKFLRLKVET